MSGKDNEVVGTKSSLETRQGRLRAQLDNLEEQALAEKTWQLKGEVSASARPQNSLLEEVVEFDLTTRPGEVVVVFDLTTRPVEVVVAFDLIRPGEVVAFDLTRPGEVAFHMTSGGGCKNVLLFN